MKRNRFITRTTKRRSSLKMSLILVGCIAVIALVRVAAPYIDKRPDPTPLACHSTGMSIETMKYHAYFRQAGAGIDALEVAKAVQHSKRKRLTAAICAIESQGKKTAYNRRSGANGAFQVMENYWGKVNTKSALAMTAQHDVIMDELLEASNGNLKKALNAYGGDKTKKVYADNILAEMSNVPLTSE